MKIIEVKTLAIPEVKIIRFARFNDQRGYFTETYRKSDLANNPDTSFMKKVNFLQCNDTFSKATTVRGLHFQWNPFMGKLIRVIVGNIIDVALDIRKNSPTFGKIVAYELGSEASHDYNDWIWVPPGFAHGVIVIKDSRVEYFCSGEYSPGCEASISPLAQDIDWSLCDKETRKKFDSIVKNTQLMTDKDKNGHTMKSWLDDKNSDNFIYGKC